MRPSAAIPWGAPPPYRAPAPEVLSALDQLYAQVDAALPEAVSTCRACGECCRFKEGGIVLFASALELACLVSSRDRVGRPEPSRQSSPSASWRCPYQEGNRCTARRMRPLGCRTYFCDPAARVEGERLYAKTLAEMRQIAEGQGPWWYGPAGAYLSAVESG